LRYEVRATEAALEDVDLIRRWIAEHGAPLTAERWVERLLVALTKLEERPTRCRLAPEDGHIEEAEVRQLLFGRFRILFTVRGKRVLVLHVRHGSRRYATQEELGQALEELERGDGEGRAR